MDILEINEEKKFIRCEPLVTVQRLVEALQAKGQCSDYYIFFVQQLSNQITKKEPKSDDRLSKFDWHDLSPFFFGHNASS